MYYVMLIKGGMSDSEANNKKWSI